MEVQGQIQLKAFGIYPSFDTYSAIWLNATLQEIFNHYQISELLDTFVLENERMCIDAMNIENWHLAFCGIRISFKTFDLPQFNYDSDLNDFLNVVIPKIRFELSGKGCTYLRDECGLNLFAILRNELPEKAHVTRIDIAYDLIDYMPDFQKKLKEFCLNPFNQSSYQRLAICNLPGGSSFSLRTGDQETVYIGAPTSDKLLRVYDKYLQKSKRGVLEDCKYGTDIKSWIRIEWQLRNKRADQILFGKASSDYFLEVFKKIYESYRFRDLSKEDTVVAEFWEELFDWEKIPSIIQKIHYVDPDQMSDKIEEVLDRSLGGIADFINLYGRAAFDKKLDNYYKRINKPQTPMDHFARRKRIYRINAALHGDLSSIRAAGRLIDNKFNPI